MRPTRLRARLPSWSAVVALLLPLAGAAASMGCRFFERRDGTATSAAASSTAASKASSRPQQSHGELHSDASVALAPLQIVGKPQVLALEHVEVAGLAWANRWLVRAVARGRRIGPTPGIYSVQPSSGAAQLVKALDDEGAHDRLQSAAAGGYARVFTKGKGLYGNGDREVLVTTDRGRTISLGKPPPLDAHRMDLESAWSSVEPALGVLTWIAIRSSGRHAERYWREGLYGYIALGSGGPRTVRLAEIPRSVDARFPVFLHAVANPTERAVVVGHSQSGGFVIELFLLDDAGSARAGPRHHRAEFTHRESAAAMTSDGSVVVARRAQASAIADARLVLTTFRSGAQTTSRTLSDNIGLAMGISAVACGPVVVIAVAASTKPGLLATGGVDVHRFVPSTGALASLSITAPAFQGRGIDVACASDRAALSYPTEGERHAFVEIRVR